MNRKTGVQKVRFLTKQDSVDLAWAEAGKGPPLVKAANWLSHLEYDWDSPVWRHWVQFFSEHYRFIRYDERGCGMSDWEVEDVSPRLWLGDLEAVVEASQPKEPFALLGISQGGAPAVQFSIKYPEKVSHLILYGAYAQGWGLRGNDEDIRQIQATIELIEIGWGKPNPIFRRLFTSLFLPEGTEEQLQWFDELCANTIKPAMAARLIQARCEVDVFDLLPKVTVPTLVIHARDDAPVPFSEGRKLASNIPNAEFVELDSCNHILLEHEPAWTRFKEAVLEFTGMSGALEGAEVFHALSEREKEILGKIVKGQTNIEIGEKLFISEKTVRNHITKIYEKLGVSSRAQAIVLARDKNFKLN